MENWIIGVPALAIWIFGIWLWRSRSNSNFQRSDFEPFSAQVAKELEVLRAAGDDAALEQWYRTQTRRWRTINWLYMAYADFLQHRGRADEAIRLLEAHIRNMRRLEDEIDRDAPGQRRALTAMLVAANRPAEAEKAAVASLARPYADAETALIYAQIARDRGDHAEAASRYLAALERFPDQETAAEGVVQAMLAQGLAQEAEEMLQILISKFPRIHSLAIQYARMAQDRGDWDEAAERWAYVREQFVFREEAYAEGAAVLRKLGRDAEAEAVLTSRPRDLSELVR